MPRAGVVHHIKSEARRHNDSRGAEIACVDLSIVLSAGIGKNAWPLDFAKRTVIASVTA
jgi:hypothetical protein